MDFREDVLAGRRQSAISCNQAVVALAQDVAIKTRLGEQTTHQVEFDEIWRADEDWDLPVYEVDEIAPGTKLNGKKLTPQFFENSAYPPNYSPRRYTGTLKTEEG